MLGQTNSKMFSASGDDRKIKMCSRQLRVDTGIQI
jgi:hypothetical protein